jgi:hypothetical protein
VKGLAVTFFAALRMTRLSGRVVKCTNFLCFDLALQKATQQAILHSAIYISIAALAMM